MSDENLSKAESIRRIGELEVNQAKLEQQIKSMSRDVKKLDDHCNKFFKILTGNGELGLTAIVKSLVQWMKEERSQKRMIGNFIYRSVIGIAIGYICIKLGVSN